ncbi:MAG: oxidoreductase [Anaerolineae bacterium]
MDKLKLAIYWGAACGGCDIAFLDIDERILEVVDVADIVFWPVAMDFKYEDVEAMGDGSIDVTFYNGAVRSTENEHIAHLLREKSKIMIAYGTCACFGGIPGLANVSNKRGVFEVVYKTTPSTVNPEFVTPQTEVKIKEGRLELPDFYDTVKSLPQVVDVDYYVPGCPPDPDRIETAIKKLIVPLAEKRELPPKGTVIAAEKSLCEECPREKYEKKITRIYRPHEIQADPEKCFLEQGLLCMGMVTRGGCGSRCINANMPCRGCLGPTAEVVDQGAAALSALASILGIDEEAEMSDEDVEKLMDQIKDPLGTFYRFTLASALINRTAIREGKDAP